MLWAVAEVEHICPFSPWARLVAAGTSDRCSDRFNMMLELIAESCLFLHGDWDTVVSVHALGTDSHATGAVPERGGIKKQ